MNDLANKGKQTPGKRTKPPEKFSLPTERSVQLMRPAWKKRIFLVL